MKHTFCATAPLRLTCGGGGTDLPDFYPKYGGFWVTAAIDKYIRVIVKPRFEPELRVSYSKLEFASCPDEIEHPIVREALKLYGVESHTEIISLADLPSGTGLGSSGAFTVALLGALEKYVGVSTWKIPEKAYEIERNTLNRMTGRQDHYAAYFGGLKSYSLTPGGEVSFDHVETGALEEHLSLFYTGKTRRSNAILEEVNKADDIMLQIKELGRLSHIALNDLTYTLFGELLHEHWELKRSISNNMSADFIDKVYNHALDNGALGGKLIGAGGGGGFLMFCSRNDGDRRKLIKALNSHMRHIPFKLVSEGLKVKEL